VLGVRQCVKGAGGGVLRGRNKRLCDAAVRQGQRGSG